MISGAAYIVKTIVFSCLQLGRPGELVCVHKTRLALDNNMSRLIKVLMLTVMFALSK